MSMKNYSVNDYGLLLTVDMLKTISLQKFGCSSEEYDADPYSFNDVLQNELIDYISEFTGSAIHITNDGHDDWFKNQEDYDGDIIYYVRTKLESTLFRAAYQDIQELIDEMKAMIGMYFPDDFDYRNQLRHIVGTYYG